MYTVRGWHLGKGVVLPPETKKRLGCPSRPGAQTEFHPGPSAFGASSASSHSPPTTLAHRFAASELPLSIVAFLSVNIRSGVADDGLNRPNRPSDDDYALHHSISSSASLSSAHLSKTQPTSRKGHPRSKKEAAEQLFSRPDAQKHAPKRRAQCSHRPSQPSIRLPARLMPHVLHRPHDHPGAPARNPASIPASKHPCTSYRCASLGCGLWLHAWRSTLGWVCFTDLLPMHGWAERVVG